MRKELQSDIIPHCYGAFKGLFGNNGGVTSLTGLVWLLRPNSVPLPSGGLAFNHTALAEAAAKLKPVATAVYTPTAEAIQRIIPTAIVSVTQIGRIATTATSMGSEKDLWIIGGVLGLCAIGAIWFVGATVWERIFGGPRVRRVAVEEAETLTGSVAVATERPRNLVGALIDGGAKSKTLVELPNGVYIDSKGAAPLYAKEELRDRFPEAMAELDRRTTELGSQLDFKAKYLG